MSSITAQVLAIAMVKFPETQNELAAGDRDTDDLDHRIMAADERRRREMLRAHHALGELMQQIPADTRWWRWSICADGTCPIEGTLAVQPDGHASRSRLMLMAEQFGFDYAEKSHLNGKNIVTATGVFSGVRVKVYDLVKPCACDGCGGA